MRCLGCMFFVLFCFFGFRSHRRDFGEAIPGRVLAERLGDFIHAACVRWGSRAYPNTVLVASWEDARELDCEGGVVGDAPTAGAGERRGEGLDEEDGDEDRLCDGLGLRGGRGADFQLHVVEPDGSIRRCRAACTGRGSGRTRKWLRRRAVGGSEDGAGAGGRGGGEGTISDRSLGGAQRLLAHMTCEEAAVSLIRAASRASDGDGRAAGDRDAARVASVMEVAWLRACEAGGSGGVEFVHHRSMEEALRHVGEEALDPGDGASDGDGFDGVSEADD